MQDAIEYRGRERRHRKRAHVVEGLLAFARQDEVQVDARVFLLLVLTQYAFLGISQDAIKAPQQREGKDDLAIVGLLVVAAQEVR